MSEKSKTYKLINLDSGKVEEITPSSSGITVSNTTTFGEAFPLGQPVSSIETIFDAFPLGQPVSSIETIFEFDPLKDVIHPAYISTYIDKDEDENKKNKERFEEFSREQTKELFRIINEQDFEYGFESQSDRFVKKLMNINSSVTKEWLNSIFIEYFDNPKILIGLLQIISHMEYLDIYPQGPTMALSILSHKNAEVQECGIRAFENWANAQSLDVLRNIQCSEIWLQEYVEEVISDIEKELGIDVVAS